MKVIIHGKPTFTVRLTRSLTGRLIEIAKLHYDAICRRAACPGGFLYGFQLHFDLVKSIHTSDEMMSWREVDTLLKILEARHGLPYTNAAVEDLNTSLHHAIQRASQLDWKVEVFPNRASTY